MFSIYFLQSFHEDSISVCWRSHGYDICSTALSVRLAFLTESLFDLLNVRRALWAEPMPLQGIEGMVMWVDVSVASRVLSTPSFQCTPASAFAELPGPGTSAWLISCITRSVVGIALNVLPECVKAVQYMLRRLTTSDISIKLLDVLPNDFLDNC